MAIGQKVIAVIDDDASIRDAMSALVVSLGFRAEVYSSGQAFIDAVRKSEASCLLVDIHLGDITGVELVHYLSTMGFTYAVIFMTPSESPVVRKQAAEVGPVAYLLKPFPINHLVKAINEAIGSAGNQIQRPHTGRT